MSATKGREGARVGGGGVGGLAPPLFMAVFTTDYWLTRGGGGCLDPPVLADNM